MTATTAADWLAPQRAALDRREARLCEVFGTLDVPDGASVAVIDDCSIVVRIGDVHWDGVRLIGRRLAAAIRIDGDSAGIDICEATSMTEPWPGGNQIALGRLKLTHRSTPQQVVDALTHELTNEQEA